MKTWSKWAIAGGFCFSLVGSFLWFKFLSAKFLSPVNIDSKFSFIKILGSSVDKPKVVYGFLPYWNLKDIEVQDELTDLAYFSLTIQGDGNVRLTEEGYEEPGYNKLKSDEFLDLINELSDKGKDLEIVLSAFNNDDIYNFLSSTKAQDNLFNNLDSLLLAYPFTGVNIDIEYTGDSDDSLRNKMNQFMDRLDKHLTKVNPDIDLSIDIYGSAASKKMIWDLPEVSKHVDYVIMMAYDYHRRSSPVSGPVAPLFGAGESIDSDITQHLKDLKNQVDADKILLGVPFYGYQWRTTSREPNENTYPNSGSTAKFEDIQKILQQKEELKVEESWNENTLSPYITYEENGAIYTIYYENSRSLFYKLELIDQLDLAGVAIWAIGYEGNNRELWDVIAQKF